MVNEVTQTGLELTSFALAHGASAVRFLLPARSKHDLAGCIATSGSPQRSRLALAMAAHALHHRNR